MEKTITLTLIVPDGQTTTCTCDALRFTIPDGQGKNKHSGGSIGIHPGHTDALMAVAAGEVRATLTGQPILHCLVGDGLAMVSGTAVTILTDRITQPATASSDAE